MMNNKLNPVKEIITPTEWNFIVTDRIRLLGETWNTLSDDDRFWMVFNWLKKYEILDPNKGKRQLFLCKHYWRMRY